MNFSPQISFRDSLLQGRPLLFDGAMASLLYDRGIFINRCFEEVNLKNPELVVQIHSDYLQAGAQVLTTNTWAANRSKLKSFGLIEEIEAINRSGVELAHKAKENSLNGGPIYIAGSIGPLGIRIEPWGPTSFEEAKDLFREQAQAMLDAGVDLFLLENFQDLNEILQALAAVKEISSVPVAALMSTDEEGQSLFGMGPEQFAKRLDEVGADIIGMNCLKGPEVGLLALPKLQKTTSRPLLLRPTAGLPKEVDGRFIYMASAEYMGNFAKRAIKQGVQLIGGGSGTTPDHIKFMAASCRQGQAFARAEIRSFTTKSCLESERIKPSEKSQWAKKLAAGEFVKTMELLPPKGIDVSALLKKSDQCKAKGFDAINIPDGPRASARMSALAAALKIEQEIHIETVLHYVCRDRNLLGIQSDLLGAHALGLRNILCLTGDPPKLGPFPFATAVFDIDAIGLTNVVHTLNGGHDLGGNSLESPLSFSIGVGANPVAIDLKTEFHRFRHKCEAGAEWCITQPVFEKNSLFHFLEFAENYKIPVVAGLWPLVSLRNAEFMANEVPGVIVPKAILARMEKWELKEDQLKEGLAIASELLEEIRPAVQGVQISAPLGRVDFALQLAL